MRTEVDFSPSPVLTQHRIKNMNPSAEFVAKNLIPTAVDPSKTRKMSLFEGVVLGAAGFTAVIGGPPLILLGLEAFPLLAAGAATGAVAGAASELQPTVRF